MNQEERSDIEAARLLSEPGSLLERLANRIDSLTKERDEAMKEAVSEKWVCSDCGSQKIKGIEYPTDCGTEYDAQCGECGSSNVGEIGQAIFDFIEGKDMWVEAHNEAVQHKRDLESAQAALRKVTEILDRTLPGGLDPLISTLCDAKTVAMKAMQALSPRPSPEKGKEG